MKDRVMFEPPSFTHIDIDWSRLVDKPFSEGRIIEAFASADAIIDTFIETALRQLYHDSKSQDLINEIHYLRARVNFDGLILLEILKSKTVVDETFIDKVRQFKKARNLVCHNTEGEYALVLQNSRIPYSNQVELNLATKKESIKWIGSAFDIFNELTEIMRVISKDQDFYFSVDFCKKNPRGKIAEQVFPKEHKKKSKTKQKTSGHHGS